jgi:hypothetical protein
MNTENFRLQKRKFNLDLASQPISGPSMHASLGAEDVKLVNTTSLPSNGFPGNKLPANLTAHVKLPDETHYLAKIYICFQIRRRHVWL